MRAPLILIGLVVAGVAEAHKPSDSYLTLGEPTTIGGRVRHPLRWDVAVRDLDRALEVDHDHDGLVRWGELRAADPRVRALLLDRLAITRGAPCTLGFDGGARVVRHSDGAYLVASLTADCPAGPARLELRYALLFDLDPQHRGLLRVAGSEQLIVFSRAQRTASVEVDEAPTRVRRLAAAIRHGVHHIWTGYDHLLFLIALLLPAVLRREAGAWRPVGSLRVALVDVLKVVTAFTAAHSITLSLAALGVLSLPARLVESAIALSVVLAALNNLRPVVGGERWLAAFALGLLHGFGFSSTLADLGLSASALLPTLVGFNLGVELGQAAVVAVFVPLAFAARRSAAYRRLALQAGSAAIALLALVWLYERVTGRTILSP